MQHRWQTYVYSCKLPANDRSVLDTLGVILNICITELHRHDRRCEIMSEREKNSEKSQPCTGARTLTARTPCVLLAFCDWI